MGRQRSTRQGVEVVPQGHDTGTGTQGVDGRAECGVPDLHSEEAQPGRGGPQQRSWEMVLPLGDSFERSKGRSAPSASLADIPDAHIFSVTTLVENNWLESLHQGPCPPLKEEVKEWLEEVGIEHTLDIRPIWASSASTITILRADHAMLFKLRWL